MQDYQKGLQQRLQDHEQELKTAKSNAPSAGGSSKSYPCYHYILLSESSEQCTSPIRVESVSGCRLHRQKTSPCALMVPGFHVAAAAVEAEAEAGPDLRELTIDDWESALAEAGDTLVVVDFFTNW